MAKDAPPTAARRTNASKPRGKRSDQRVRVRGRSFARKMQERRAQSRAVRRGWFNSEAGKMLRLTSPLARALARAFGVASQPSLRIAGAILRRISRFTAASIDLRDGIFVNTEERRSGDLEGERGERKDSSCSAGIKCAEDFMKCGFEPMGSVPNGRGQWAWLF